VPEGQETYLLHPTTNSAATSGIPTAELGGTALMATGHVKVLKT
jgi:hypothetical protein